MKPTPLLIAALVLATVMVVAVGLYSSWPGSWPGSWPASWSGSGPVEPSGPEQRTSAQVGMAASAVRAPVGHSPDVQTRPRNGEAVAPAVTPVRGEAVRVPQIAVTPAAAETALRSMLAADTEPPRLWGPGENEPADIAAFKQMLEAMEAFAAGHGEDYEAWMAMISEAVGPAEAAFLHETLMADHEWDTLRALLDERAGLTGYDYRDLVMGLGLTTGQISLQEINALIDGGVPLPELSGHLLAYSGRVEEMVALAQRGQISDLYMRDPLLGDTVVGGLIEHLRSAPELGAPAAIAKLQALLDLGIEPSQRHGNQDLLARIMISTTPRNAQVMVPLARHLLQTGTVVTAEHRAIIARSPPSPLRSLYEWVLNNP